MFRLLKFLLLLLILLSCSTKNIIAENNEKLHAEIKIGNYDVIEKLIFNGADVNAPKQYIFGDLYPLNQAIRSGNFEIVKLLIKHGAKIDTENNDRSCLSDAIHKKIKPIIQYLLSKGIYVNRSCNSQLIFSALYSCSFEMLQYVIEDLRVCIDSRETHYLNTPIYKTVRDDLYHETRYLIRKGANVNIPNKDNETPLHAAVMGKKIKLIELLLKNGANTTIKDEKGLTPFDYAKKANNKQIVDLLMRYGK